MGNKRKHRLLIFDDSPIYFDGNNCKVNPLTRLYEELTNYFEVVVSGPVKYVNEPVEGYEAKGITYSSRPFYTSVLEFLKKIPQIFISTIRNINKNVRNTDMVMLKLPLPIGILAYGLAKKHSKPCFLYIGGSIKKVVAEGRKHNNVARWLSLFTANIFFLLSKWMAKDSLVFVVGSELYREFSPFANHCVNFTPSIISKTDIYPKSDTCQRNPIKLLFVGRLAPVKGLRYLFEAMNILMNEGIKVKLEIVGEGSHKPQLVKEAERLGIVDQIHFHGQIPFGLELFKIYREADIFVLPSLSEGIPKTLIEAMASGVPIVATKVGGIPDVIRDGQTGLLIKPRYSKEIAGGIERIINNQDLRQKIIKNGYRFVKEHTIEKQAQFMASTIYQHLLCAIDNNFKTEVKLR